MRLLATRIFNLRIFLQEKSHEANSCFEHQEVSNRTKGWIRIRCYFDRGLIRKETQHKLEAWSCKTAIFRQEPNSFFKPFSHNETGYIQKYSLNVNYFSPQALVTLHGSTRDNPIIKQLQVIDILRALQAGAKSVASSSGISLVASQPCKIQT